MAIGANRLVDTGISNMYTDAQEDHVPQLKLIQRAVQNPEKELEFDEVASVVSELDSSIGDSMSEEDTEVGSDEECTLMPDIDFKNIFLNSDATTDMDSEAALSLRCLPSRQDIDFIGIASLSVPSCLLIAYLGSESVLNLHAACRSVRTFSSTPCLDRRVRRLMERICDKFASEVLKKECIMKEQKKHLMSPVLTALNATHDCKLEKLRAFSVFLLSCAQLNIGRRQLLLEAFVEARRIERLALHKQLFLQSVNHCQVLRNGIRDCEYCGYGDAVSVVSQCSSSSE